MCFRRTCTATSLTLPESPQFPSSCRARESATLLRHPEHHNVITSLTLPESPQFRSSCRARESAAPLRHPEHHNAKRHTRSSCRAGESAAPLRHPEHHKAKRHTRWLLVVLLVLLNTLKELTNKERKTSERKHCVPIKTLCIMIQMLKVKNATS
ncbi:uncharacterized protein LOC119478922 isoform X3 [Sebastes umbrosus]|uniref:uncharacterized protein LOC119478922 isoform X3 n=1 Tax=Sebastes umbrosus TaxID=72105 RepID=UPI00189D279B|nr:uncharacterized protein LOC119478922 isoform X3 [Sebastes umbrosus]